MKDIWTDIQNVANALDIPRAGEDLIRALTTRMRENAASMRPVTVTLHLSLHQDRKHRQVVRL